MSKNDPKVITFEVITEELKLITRVKAGDVFIGSEVSISEENEFRMNGQPFNIGTEEHEVKTYWGIRIRCLIVNISLASIII